MNVLEHYYMSLDNEAKRHSAEALKAAESGDERTRSIHLMQASMLGDMLKVLGRVEYEGKKPKALENLINSFSEEAERLRKSGDYDASDRAEKKAITIQFALDALSEAKSYGE